MWNSVTKIETGSYYHLKVQQWICELCNMNGIDDGSYVLDQCSQHSHISKTSILRLIKSYAGVEHIGDVYKHGCYNDLMTYIET